jgi:hypothetical protein
MTKLVSMSGIVTILLLVYSFSPCAGETVNLASADKGSLIKMEINIA